MKKIERYSKTIEVTVETSEVFTFRRNRESVSTGRQKRRGETPEADIEDNLRDAGHERTEIGAIEAEENIRPASLGDVDPI